jgi:hypothetical protein
MKSRFPSPGPSATLRAFAKSGRLSEACARLGMAELHRPFVGSPPLREGLRCLRMTTLLEEAVESHLSQGGAWGVGLMSPKFYFLCRVPIRFSSGGIPSHPFAKNAKGWGTPIFVALAKIKIVLLCLRFKPTQCAVRRRPFVSAARFGPYLRRSSRKMGLSMCPEGFGTITVARC